MEKTREEKKLSSCAQGRFNAFQRTMLQWNSLHPYNAVHMVRIPGAPNQDLLRHAIDRTLGAHALVGLTLNRDQRTYCYRGGPVCYEMKNLDAVKSAGTLLSVEIERQLNTPFELSEPFTPFRFFITQYEHSFVLGLVYLHPVADAESIVLLLKEIVRNYLGNEIGNNDRAGSRIRPPRAGNLIFSHPGAFLRKLAALPAFVQNLRTSCRPPCRDANDFHNGFHLFSLEHRRLRCLLETAKSWGITANDLLLALLIKSCALLATGRERAARRTKISAGCIVNIRKDLASETHGAFGLHLGSFVITHAVPGQIALKDLARDIGRVTLEIKRKKLYLATALELSFGSFMLSFFSVERRKKLYQKHYPLWGGLTNMNINSLWQPLGSDKPLDYIRAVSTGPATPLVLSFTTVGDVANIGLSYRLTVYSRADIDRFVDCFLGMAADLEASS